jgi:hypothetical protein
MPVLTMIKDLKTILELVLNKMPAGKNYSEESNLILKAGKSMKKLCTMIEIGMTAMADASGYAIFYNRWLLIDSGILVSSCMFSYRERFEWAERALEAVRNLDLAAIKSFEHHQFNESDTGYQEENSNKRKRT